MLLFFLDIVCYIALFFLFAVFGGPSSVLCSFNAYFFGMFLMSLFLLFLKFESLFEEETIFCFYVGVLGNKAVGKLCFWFNPP